MTADRRGPSGPLAGMGRPKRRAIDVSGLALVQAGALTPGERLPWLVTPATAGIDLPAWAGLHKHWVDERLRECGALLFRGFGVTTESMFEALARTVCSQLIDQNGEHEPVPDSSFVQTPVAYSPTQKLLWHNENTFNHSWPLRILFCCVRPSDTGGETPLVDSRTVFEQIPVHIRERFLQHGVMYVRNFGVGFGLDWQRVFQVRSRAELEDAARGSYVRLTWQGDSRLRAVSVRPAAIRHPQTGEWTWLNQVQHWHTACLDPQVRATLLSSYAEADLPRNCYFGDGSAIPDEFMFEILRVYQQAERSFPWHAGDVLLVDNALTAHARNPYAGARKLLVALGDPLCFPPPAHHAQGPHAPSFK